MIIFRYLTKEVYATLLAATLILLIIFISNQLIHYLGVAASGGIPPRTVLQLMSLQVPLLLGYMLPLGLFLGILLAYGRLYVDNEMTVLVACGYSKAQLLRTTLIFSTLIAAIVSVLMLIVEPKLAWYRDHIFAEAAAASPIETIFPKRFQPLGNQWVIYVGDISNNKKELDDVFVAHMPDGTGTPDAPWVVVSAEGGHQWVDPKTNDEFMILNNGYRYLGVPGQKDFQIVKYDQYGVRIQQGKFHMAKEAEFMSTPELWQRRHTDLAAMTELQWRFSMPVSALILAFMAVPLSRIRPRGGRYVKILPAILIYIIYADLIFVGEAALQKGKLAPVLGLWWIHLGMFGLGIVLMLYYIGINQIKSWFR